jgi:hypothetical protein
MRGWGRSASAAALERSGQAAKSALSLGDHIRANVIGAVCPATGECYATIFDGVDSDVFQFYLDRLAQEISAVDSKRRLLIVDNASWHKTKRLNWHELHFLPGYSPDFNPIERLWLRLKADFFSDFIAKSSRNSQNVFVTRWAPSWTTPKKSPLSALSGNNLREML